MLKWTGKGEPPYGFEVDTDDTVYKSYGEQRVLKEVSEGLEKQKSFAEIANLLNLNQMETRKGRPWNRHSLRRALQSHEKGKHFQESTSF